jgi:flavin-dependent dehydrogenase
VRWQKTALWLLLMSWLVGGAKANVPFAGWLFTLTDNGWRLGVVADL